MPRLIKAAILCGIVPLLAGTFIYATWRITRWDALVTAGMITIGVGLLAFTGGAVCLLRQSWDASEAPATRRRLRVQGGFALALLLINFPAAAFYTLSAIDVETRYTVRVYNDSDRLIESLVVTGPGVRAELGPIASGGRAQRHLYFRGDGTLDFTAHQQGMEFSGQLEDYVTGSLGGERTIRIKRRGMYDLEPTPPNTAP